MNFPADPLPCQGTMGEPLTCLSFMDPRPCGHLVHGDVRELQVLHSQAEILEKLVLQTQLLDSIASHGRCFRKRVRGWGGVGGVERPGRLRPARRGRQKVCSWSSHTQPTSMAPHSPWSRAGRPTLPFPAWSLLPWRGHACGLDWVPWQSQPCGLVREVPGSWGTLACSLWACTKQRAPFSPARGSTQHILPPAMSKVSSTVHLIPSDQERKKPLFNH